jgi:hypothetical protein
MKKYTGVRKRPKTASCVNPDVEEENRETHVVPDTDADPAKPREKDLPRDLAGFFRPALWLAD